MLSKKPLLLIICLLLQTTVHAQWIKEKFDRLELSENFDTINRMWSTVANADNLFIVQEGEYILNRKTIISPFVILADYENNFSAFRMVTSLKLERSLNDEGTVGVMFMTQPDGKGGFIFEINKLKQYRLRQLSGGAYKYLTGASAQGGWVPSKNVNETNNYNLFDVRTSNGNYDLFLNGSFLYSFSESAYRSGKFGIVVGPGTKARADFLYLFSYSKAPEMIAADPVEKTSATAAASKDAGPDLIELTESIIKLKTQINKLTETNEDLRRTIEAMKSDDDEVENQKKNYEKNMKAIQAKLDKSAAGFDSLLRVNQELLKYKDLVAGNENSDLIISLSKSLKAEKATSDQLRKQNKELTDSLSVMKAEMQKKNTGKTVAQPAAKPEENNKPRSENNFVLPQENKP